MPRNHSNFQPIKDFCRIAANKKLQGILCTAWDDSSPHFETYWRGFNFFALFSWNYKDIPLKDAEAIFRHRFYGPALSDSSYEFQDLLEQELYYWETALMDKDNRKTTKNIDLISLPDAENQGKWSEKYDRKIEGAQKAVEQYKIIRDKINTAAKMTRRNRYSLSLMNQINELQIYPAKLILLLEDYDKASATDKKEWLIKILKYVNSFKAIREHFEDIFSKTRMLGKPVNYQLDQNHAHHLANTTLNSDWMYLIELKMNDEILQWKKNIKAEPAF
jgi:hypothetical protein